MMVYVRCVHDGVKLGFIFISQNFIPLIISQDQWQAIVP